MTHPLTITVDVEAFPSNAAGDCVSTLVYGNFGGEAYGIGRMCQIASSYGLELTFFVDYGETDLHGSAWLDVPRYIQRMGHDVQAHLHCENLPLQTRERLAMSENWSMFSATAEQAEFLAETIIERHMAAIGKKPVAFRGGGYRYNGNILRSLGQRGVAYDFSYNPGRANQPFNEGALAPFKWQDTGITEIPISCMPAFAGRKGHVELNFNEALFLRQNVEEGVACFEKYLDAYFECFPNGVATLVAHCWSLLAKNGQGKFVAPNPAALETFKGICELAARKYDHISARQLYEQGFSAKRNIAWRPNKFAIAASKDKQGACPICGSTAMREANGIKNHTCSGCGAFDRHRALGLLIHSPKAQLDLKGKKILMLANSRPENRLLKLIGADYTTLDARPEVQTDIVADVADLAQIPAQSFDCVLACSVLQVVWDLDGALRELCRILKPGGVLLHFDFCNVDDITRAKTKIEEITDYYGQENLEKFNCGAWRRFGDLDIDEYFAPYFERDRFVITDPIRQTSHRWNIWRKTPEAVEFGSDSFPRRAPAANGLPDIARKLYLLAAVNFDQGNHDLAFKLWDLLLERFTGQKGANSAWLAYVAPGQKPRAIVDEPEMQLDLAGEMIILVGDLRALLAGLANCQASCPIIIIDQKAMAAGYCVSLLARLQIGAAASARIIASGEAAAEAIRLLHIFQGDVVFIMIGGAIDATSLRKLDSSLLARIALTWLCPYGESAADAALRAFVVDFDYTMLKSARYFICSRPLPPQIELMGSPGNTNNVYERYNMREVCLPERVSHHSFVYNYGDLYALFTPPVNWAQEWHSSPAFAFNLNKLSFLQSLPREHVKAVLTDYLAFHATHKNKFYSNDHAACERIYSLLPLLGDFQQRDDAEGADLCIQSMRLDLAFLLDDANYARRSNHGMMADLAILTLANSNTDLVSAREKERIIQRGIENIAAIFSANGISLEHSIAYQEWNAAYAWRFFEELGKCAGYGELAAQWQSRISYGTETLWRRPGKGRELFASWRFAPPAQAATAPFLSAGTSEQTSAVFWRTCSKTRSHVF